MAKQIAVVSKYQAGIAGTIDDIGCKVELAGGLRYVDCRTPGRIRSYRFEICDVVERDICQWRATWITNRVDKLGEQWKRVFGVCHRILGTITDRLEKLGNALGWLDFSPDYHWINKVANDFSLIRLRAPSRGC